MSLIFLHKIYCFILALYNFFVILCIKINHYDSPTLSGYISLRGPSHKRQEQQCCTPNPGSISHSTQDWKADNVQKLQHYITCCTPVWLSHQDRDTDKHKSCIKRTNMRNMNIIKRKSTLSTAQHLSVKCFNVFTAIK